MTHMESYLIGTLFEEEEKDKKQNFYNQIARDEKGHKRFHGAFTGGFQAGYKNTCGSKEGWVPTQFVSSRSNRAKYQPQSILQFMDEEDLGQTKVGENLMTNEEYTDTLGVNAKETTKQEAKDFFGFEIPQELLISTKKESIGISILKAMKQAGVGGSSKKIIGAAIPEKKPDFDIMRNVQYKDGFGGLGVEKVELEMEGDWFSEQFQGVYRRKTKKDDVNDEEEDEKNKIKNRIKFSGFTENPEDEDYSNFEISHEDRDISSNFSHPNPSSRRIPTNPLDRYEKSANPYILPLHQSTVKIPSDYNPFYRLTSKPKEPSFTILGGALTLEQRKALLEEPDQQQKPQQNKPLKKISEETKQKILNLKQFVKGSVQDMEGDHIESVFKDKSKQERYLNFCFEKEGKIVGGIPPAFNMTLEDLQAEIKEFEQVYDMFKHFKKEEKGKETQSNKQNEHRRTLQQWIPEKLVCKRFGVPQPFQGKLAPLNQQKALIEKRNVFESQIQPLFEEGRKKAEIETVQEKEEPISEGGSSGKEEESEEEKEQKPSLELFKSIFDNDED